jgi:hypothetical protein
MTDTMPLLSDSQQLRLLDADSLSAEYLPYILLVTFLWFMATSTYLLRRALKSGTGPMSGR